MTTNALTLARLAERFGLVLKPKHTDDSNTVVTGLATLEDAVAGQVAFLDADRYRPQLPYTRASAVVLHAADESLSPCAALISEQPRAAYVALAEFFHRDAQPSAGIHPTAVMGTHVQLAPNVSIAPYCVIGNNVILGEGVSLGAGCVVGDDTVIGAYSRCWPKVTIYHGSRIGEHVVVHSGTVIGSDGFGYLPVAEGWRKIPQLGRVVIHDRVEIGANTVIDRGALGDTVIGKGVILDNLIQIAHNVRIGDYTAIAACTGIAGSTTIGQRCSIGGGTGIAGHINITDDVIITGMGMITGSIKKPGVYSSGTGYQANTEWRKSVARFYQLDTLFRRVFSLEKLIKQFTKGSLHE